MISKTTFKSLLQVGSLATLAAIALLTTGCEQENDRTLAQAQACLDKATTAAAASACAQKVAGLETPAAYLIRCSANFISQGFTGDRIAKAYERLSSGGSGTNDPTLNLMAYLVFQPGDAANSVANTVNNCVRSGSASMERLSRIADLATSSAAFGGFDLTQIDPNLPPADLVPKLKDALDDAFAAVAGATTAQKEAFANTAISAATSLCAPGSSFSSNDVCSTMDGALAFAKNPDGSIDSAALTSKLLELFKNK